MKATGRRRRRRLKLPFNLKFVTMIVIILKKTVYMLNSELGLHHFKRVELVNLLILDRVPQCWISVYLLFLLKPSLVRMETELASRQGPHSDIGFMHPTKVAD